MHKVPSLILIGALLAAAPVASAQRTATKGRGPAAKSSDPNNLVTRMMQFDADKDGQLTREEVTDERLRGVFDRADADQDGTVTKAELASMAARGRSNGRGNNNPRNFGGGPGGPPPGGGPGMGMGMEMRGPRPKPGEVLPQMLQQRLKLTADQQSQVKELQKEVDARLAKILTGDQKAQLEEMQAQGPPGGPGGFGGPPPGGFGGGPGGPPPGGFGDGPGPGDDGSPPPEF